ncbi:indolepyruvate ferredoxin oxidoreductase, alpha subunit [Fibrobacteria bacterium R8-3-H12]
MEHKTKTLMLGDHAVAQGAYEAGVKVAAAYPGTPSTEITEYMAGFKEVNAEWSVNEKVSMEVGIGAAMAGRRALVAMKHVGLNVAADPLFTFSYTGLNAGLVVAVADDPGMHSSQNEQDSRYYAQSAHVPMLEPADSQEARDFTMLAYELSEKYDTPVFSGMEFIGIAIGGNIEIFYLNPLGMALLYKHYNSEARWLLQKSPKTTEVTI